MNQHAYALAVENWTPRRASGNNEPLIIDLFAGGGGASEAILQATGRHPDIAVNHDREAIGMHEANHPDTLHLCDDIRVVDPFLVLTTLFPGRPVGILWASPDCKDHSKAKGGVPKDKNIRGLAWEVIRWVAAIRRATGSAPALVALENVEEFADWGPLHTQGKRAGRVNKKRRKETFNLWKDQLVSLGGVVRHGELVAADFGAPTTRKRLFLICRFDGQAIQWPKPTHMRRDKMNGDLFDLQPWRMAAEIINWNLPVPSIFDRKRELAPKTQKRIAKGVKRYVIEAAKPFIIPVTHSTAGARAYDIGDPLRTATTSKGGDFQLIAPYVGPVNHGGGEGRVYDVRDSMRTITCAPRGEQALFAPLLTPRYGERPGQEPRALDIRGPYPTVVPDGNGGSLVGAHLIRTDMQSSAPRTGVHPATDPVRTITAGGGFATVAYKLAPFVVSTAYGDGRERAGLRAWPSSEPLRTITASTDGAIAAVVLQKMSENGQGYSPRDALHTVMAGAPRHAEIVAYLGRQFGTSTTGRSLMDPHPAVMSNGGGGKSQLVAANITRMEKGAAGSGPTDPINTTTARPKDALSLTFLDKYYETGVPAAVDRPLDSVTSRDRFGLAAAHIEQANTGLIGHAPTKPLSTIVSKGCTQRIIETTMAELGAAEGSKRRKVLEFLWEHFGAPTDEEWADPTSTAQARLRFGLVVLGDDIYQIVDIGMRMLTPRELYAAQGFRDSYVIDLTLDGKPLTKTAQTRMAGNSVSPPPARALLEANLPRAFQMAKAA